MARSKTQAVFRVEEVNALVLDVTYDHRRLRPSSVHRLLSEFGVTTQLAPGIVRIDLYPSQRLDSVTAYLQDFATKEAEANGLLRDSER